MCVVTSTVITAKHPHISLQLLILGFGALKKNQQTNDKIIILKLGKHLVMFFCVYMRQTIPAFLTAQLLLFFSR